MPLFAPFRRRINRQRPIVIVHEGWRNPGDAISALGVRSIVEELGFREICEYSITDYATWMQFFDEIEIHAIILAGAPWIWDRCNESDKFQSLQKARKALPQARWIMAGGGASFLLQHVEQSFRNLQLDLSVFETFTLCIGRDFLACDQLIRTNPNTILLPCPSTLLATVKPQLLKVTKSQKNVFQHNLRSDRIAPFVAEDFLLTYEQLCAQHERNGYGAIPWMADVSNQPVSTPGDVLLALARTERYFSSRVHASIPCHALGAQGELFAVDSRAMTAMHVGVPICGPYADRFRICFADAETFQLNPTQIRAGYLTALGKALN